MFEVRIHEDATPGSKMTMNEELEKQVMSFRDCFGQVETNVSWIDFDPQKYIFQTRASVKKSIHGIDKGTLHLFCAANKIYTFNFQIHITR